MNILVTSIVDPEVTPHSRLHQFLGFLSIKHSITVVAPRDTWKIGYDRAPATTPIFNVRYLSGGRPFIQEPLAQFNLRSILDSHMLKNTHVHFDYNSLFLGVAARRLLGRYGIPTVYDLADDLPAMAGGSQQIPFILRPVAKTIAGRLLRSNIRSATKVTVTINSLANIFSIPKEKYVVIPNGVSFRRFIMRPPKPTHTPMRVVLVGALREWIQLENVLRALPNDAELVVAGGEGLERMMQLARKLEVSGHVRFLGVVPYSKLPPLLRKMDIGILPFAPGSVTDHAAPLKFFEYAAAGLPIISSPIPEVIRLGKNDILLANSLQEWRDAFMKITNRYSEALSRTARLRHRLQSFDWDTLSRKMERVLQQTANKHQ